MVAAIKKSTSTGKSRASSARPRGRSASAKPKGRSAKAAKPRDTTRSRSRASRSEASKSRSGSSKTPAAAAKPKTTRPMSGYHMYVKEQMADKSFNDGKGSLVAAMKEVAASWKTVSDKDKAKYKAQADRANTKSGRTGKSKRRAQ